MKRHCLYCWKQEINPQKVFECDCHCNYLHLMSNETKEIKQIELREVALWIIILIAVFS